MLDVILTNGEDMKIHRVSLRTRIRARLRAARLDRELSDGASPDGDPARAVRALTLVRPRELGRLADGLERLRDTARHRTRFTSRPAIPVDRAGIRAADPLITSLIAELQAGTIDVRGVATLRSLMADGGGPFYRAVPGRDLRRELARARVLVTTRFPPPQTRGRRRVGAAVPRRSEDG